jgi:GGDEF domain-containing protein
VESLTACDRATATEVERCAVLLSARLEEVGALSTASPAQRLARAAARLAAIEDFEGLVREALAAALELSGYESGVVALADGHGAHYPHVAEGPFAVALSQLTADELAPIARWVEECASSYTVGDAGGRGFAGHEALRRLGAASLIVLPLAAAGQRLGVIVLADRANRRPAFEDVELLELVAAQVAGGLRMASAVAQLRERASRDPLTGLHASLPSLPACTGVVLADVDGLPGIADAGGRTAADGVLRAMAGLLREVTPAGGRAFRIGDDSFVVALEAPYAVSAERVSWELRSLAPARLGTTLSVGVAVGGPGESGEAVVLRAGAALSEAKRRGGNAVHGDGSA